MLTHFLKGGKPSFPFFSYVEIFFWTKGAWPNSSPKYTTEFSVCHGLGHRRFRDRAECPIDHVEVFHCVKVWIRRNLEPLHLSTEVWALAFIIRRNPSSHMCGRWSVIMARSRFSGWAKYTRFVEWRDQLSSCTWRLGILTWLGECVPEVW